MLYIYNNNITFIVDNKAIRSVAKSKTHYAVNFRYTTKLLSRCHPPVTLVYTYRLTRIQKLKKNIKQLKASRISGCLINIVLRWWNKSWYRENKTYIRSNRHEDVKNLNMTLIDREGKMPSPENEWQDIEEERRMERACGENVWGPKNVPTE